MVYIVMMKHKLHGGNNFCTIVSALFHCINDPHITIHTLNSTKGTNIWCPILCISIQQTDIRIGVQFM